MISVSVVWSEPGLSFLCYPDRTSEDRLSADIKSEAGVWSSVRDEICSSRDVLCHLRVVLVTPSVSQSVRDLRPRDGVPVPGWLPD